MANNKVNTKALKKGRTAVKNVVGKVHGQMLTTADEVIEGSVKTGLKYQKMTAKAIKNTEPLIEKQIDIMFDALEEIQGQFTVGTKRFKKLVGFNEAAKFAQKTVKETVATVGENVDTVKKTVKKYTGADFPTFEEVKEVASSTVSKVTGSASKAAAAGTKKATKAAKTISKATNKAVKPVAKKTAKKVRKVTNKTVKPVAKKAAKTVKPVAKKVAKTVKPVAKKTTKKVTRRKATAVKGETLRVVDGIGPAVEKHLIANGVNTLSKLSKISPKKLTGIMVNVGPRYANFDPNPWIMEATIYAN